MKVADLKEELKKRGLSQKGKKEELLQRLKASENETTTTPTSEMHEGGKGNQKQTKKRKKPEGKDNKGNQKIM